MLTIILKILSILGIILLFVLITILGLLLLVLFMPVVYCIKASKDADMMAASLKIRWLFGFIRASYAYPKPGIITVKVLWFTLFDSQKRATKLNETESANEENKSEADKQEQSDTKAQRNSTVENTSEDTQTNQNLEEMHEDTSKSTECEQESSGDKSFKEKLFAKYEKIKYTISQICDKIKHIWENITFYKNLLQDEDTKLLISHAFKRIGRILKSIRPRKLKAQILFGAASPDTTGYAYGLYGMLSPKLGKYVVVTPDFTQSILEGDIYAAGHLTIFTILRQALSLLFDKRLHLLKRRLDAHSKKMKQKT